MLEQIVKIINKENEKHKNLFIVSESLEYHYENKDELCINLLYALYENQSSFGAYMIISSKDGKYVRLKSCRVLRKDGIVVDEEAILNEWCSSTPEEIAKETIKKLEKLAST